MRHTHSMVWPDRHDVTFFRGASIAEPARLLVVGARVVSAGIFIVSSRHLLWAAVLLGLAACPGTADAKTAFSGGYVGGTAGYGSGQ